MPTNTSHFVAAPLASVDDSESSGHVAKKLRPVPEDGILGCLGAQCLDTQGGQGGADQGEMHSLSQLWDRDEGHSS